MSTTSTQFQSPRLINLAQSCVIKQRGKVFPTDEYIFGIVLNYILDVDHSYPLVLPYIPRSTTPPASPLRLPSLIVSEFGTGQHITSRG